MHEWDAGDVHAPLLCLPGLVRTGNDFLEVAHAVGAGRRVVAPDYPGRGASGRSADVSRYAPEACLRDVLDLCAALHLHQVIAVGTSFGGLLSMGIAAARPTLLRGVVLNDVGPDIGTAGSDFVRRFVADDPALPDLDACAAHLRALLPHLSLTTDAAWRSMARLTYAAGRGRTVSPALGHRHRPPAGGTHAAALAAVRRAGARPAAAGLGRGERYFAAATVAAMRAARPDMAVVSLPGVGHAPTLTEPAVLDALETFLERVG